MITSDEVKQKLSQPTGVHAPKQYQQPVLRRFGDVRDVTLRSRRGPKMIQIFRLLVYRDLTLTVLQRCSYVTLSNLVSVFAGMHVVPRLSERCRVISSKPSKKLVLKRHF